MRRRLPVLVLAAAALLAAPACSVKKLAINALGNALASGGSTYASDDDPELVRDAIPFGLKTIEGLLAESPNHRPLLVAAASGFTQYGYAFVQQEADLTESKDFARASELRVRARKLYLRALEYGLRGLEVAHPGFRQGIRGDVKKALSAATTADVPALYWTSAAWGAVISITKENAELTADLGLVEALMRRALELNEAYALGTLHDFFISYEGGRPPAAGGSVERARTHFEKAVALSKGMRAAPYVSFAETVSVGRQNRKEFEELLNQALAIDVDKVPDQRLANLVSQKRARWLLSRADELFLE